MKITVRSNVWETNSSSIHAIAIPRKNVDISKNSSTYSHIYFTHDEFGWEHHWYSDITNRASYLFQAISDTYLPYKVEVDYNDDLKEKIKKFNEIKNWIFDVLAKYNIIAIFDGKDFDSDGWSIGYIDHGSSELKEFLDYVLGNEKHLLTYLFGNTTICTSNDNDDMDDIAEFGRDFSEKDYKIFYKGN